MEPRRANSDGATREEQTRRTTRVGRRTGTTSCSSRASARRVLLGLARSHRHAVVQPQEQGSALFPTSGQRLNDGLEVVSTHSMLASAGGRSAVLMPALVGGRLGCNALAATMYAP